MNEIFHEENPNVLYQPCDDSETLIVFFGSMGSHTRKDFEWQGSSQHVGEKRLYLKDPHSVWYQKGISGLGRNIDETAHWLRGVYERVGAKRIVHFGVSGGGYAAMLFGWMLNVNSVVAISPRTYLDLKNRRKNGDYRLFARAKCLYLYTQAQPEYFDLLSFFENTPHLGVTINIHYAKGQRLDAMHAQRMQNVPGVSLYAYDFDAHQGFGRYLFNLGVLQAILLRTT